MIHIVNYSVEAIIDLQLLDETMGQRIVRKIGEYVASPDPMVFAKPLSGALKGCYRFRIGDYRATFQKLPKRRIMILEILKVEHRSKAY